MTPDFIALSVVVLPTVPVLVAGQVASARCIAFEASVGLLNGPNLAWFNSSGQRVENGSGISVIPQLLDRPASGTIQFDVLRTSHARRYTCMYVLSSPALNPPLNGTESTDLLVQSEWLDGGVNYSILVTVEWNSPYISMCSCVYNIHHKVATS